MLKDKYEQWGVPFSDLIGEILTKIDAGTEEIEFTLLNGRRFLMHHTQDCCESVCVESIIGDLNDLIGTPITLAEEAIGETPSDFQFPYEPESYQWTFYKLATIKGYVDIRWLGESNGYYSEGVDFTEK